MPRNVRDAIQESRAAAREQAETALQDSILGAFSSNYLATKPYGLDQRYIAARRLSEYAAERAKPQAADIVGMIPDYLYKDYVVKTGELALLTPAEHCPAAFETPKAPGATLNSAAFLAPDTVESPAYGSMQRGAPNDIPHPCGEAVSVSMAPAPLRSLQRPECDAIAQAAAAVAGRSSTYRPFYLVGATYARSCPSESSAVGILRHLNALGFRPSAVHFSENITSLNE